MEIGMNGKFEEDVFDNMIEISGLSNGVYFLSAKNIKITFIKKYILN